MSSISDMMIDYAPMQEPDYDFERFNELLDEQFSNEFKQRFESDFLREFSEVENERY